MFTRNVPNRRRRAAASGFTLIELLLVLAILAILATIVVTATAGRTEGARKTKAAVEIAEIGKGITEFEMDCGRYPTTEEGLQALLTAPPELQGKWKRVYLGKQALPLDPWGKPYVYKLLQSENGGESSYELLSTGPDGKEGTADDVSNQTKAP
ncbi:MAG TPA: type II secretion system major pseudopilin GspG [Humisphaera sp.]